jgi:phosphatidylglycerophosphate synthase
VTPRAAQALLPLFALVAVLLATLFVFTGRTLLFGAPRTPELEHRSRSRLWVFLQEWWVWLYGPVERGCLRLGVSPDALTVTSTALGAVAAILLAAGHLSTGGWVYLFGASLDFVDGRVARASGRVSRAGAFLDSTLDRVSELLVLSGLAVGFRASPALAAALVAAGSSFLISYARARGEALGVAADAKVGAMERPERVVLTGLACALSPIADLAFGDGAGRALVGSALTVLAVLATLTAARRIASVYRALRLADPVPRPQPRSLASVFKLEPRRRKAVR